MKPYILNIMALMLLSVLPCTAKSLPADAASEDDYMDFWKSAPADIASRYEEAAGRFNEDWVLAFADTLASLGESSKEKEYLYYAAELRCHHAFNEMDSVAFFTNSNQCIDLARKMKHSELYFAEKMNQVSFFLNEGRNHNALRAAQNMIDDASEMNDRYGMYFGHYALGVIFGVMGDCERSNSNYEKALENYRSNKDQDVLTRAQIYGLIAVNHLNAGHYEKALEYADLSVDAAPSEDDVPACQALACYHLGRTEEFRKHVEDYFSKENHNSIAYDYYGGWLSLLTDALDGKFEDALETCGKFEDYGDMMSATAEVYKIKGEWDKAYECLSAASQYDNSNKGDIFGDEIAEMDKELDSLISIKQKDEQIIRLRLVIIMSIIIALTAALFSIINNYRKKELMHAKDREIAYNQTYTTLVENAPFGCSKGGLIYNSEGRVVDYVTMDANKILRDAFNKVSAFKVGEHTIMESYPQSGKDIIDKINEARDKGWKYLRFTYHLTEFENWYEMIIMFSGKDTVQIFSLNTTDLARARMELMETNAELVKAKERAEKSDMLKTQFVQNMSHEIRTPLNAIVGFAQLLSLPDGFNTEEEKAQYSDYIQNNSSMLMMLIDDILDISDAENGSYRIVLEDAPVNFICRNAIKSVEYRTPPGVEMKFTTEVGDDYVVNTDARRVQQVIINYLTNACKHTESGSITVHCSTSENPGRVTFSVTDTGCGVPPEMAQNIFERFTKLDAFKQGAGLGLNICSTIAAKLGGKVYLDTSYKDGARFVFVI